LPEKLDMPTSRELYDEADRLKDQGKLPEAAAKLQSLLETDPGYALAHSALAVIYGRLGQHEQAIKHGVKVCELEPNDPFSFTALSVTYQRAGRIPEAEEAMYRARMMQGH
jgi:Flp pilus assembly protein TadD